MMKFARIAERLRFVESFKGRGENLLFVPRIVTRLIPCAVV